MTITITLSEILDKCYDWEEYCRDSGYSEWAVNEGGGDIAVNMTEEEAKKYGIIRTECQQYQ
jgi:hypothetical protein